MPGVEQLATRYMGTDSVWEVSLQADNGRAVLPGSSTPWAATARRIVNMKIAEPSLEDVFIHLTGKALRD